MRLIAAPILIILCSSVAVAGSWRQRTFRGTPPLIVGTEYRIPANPDSPWLESIAVASTSSGGVVVWTESGPREQESTVRLARLGCGRASHRCRRTSTV